MMGQTRTIPTGRLGSQNLGQVGEPRRTAFSSDQTMSLNGAMLVAAMTCLVAVPSSARCPSGRGRGVLRGHGEWDRDMPLII